MTGTCRFPITYQPLLLLLFKKVASLITILRSKATKVVSLNFLWSLVWLYLDKLKELFGECIEFMFQFGWRLLIVYGKKITVTCMF